MHHGILALLSFLPRLDRRVRQKGNEQKHLRQSFLVAIEVKETKKNGLRQRFFGYLLHKGKKPAATFFKTFYIMVEKTLAATIITELVCQTNIVFVKSRKSIQKKIRILKSRFTERCFAKNAKWETSWRSQSLSLELF